LKDAKALPGVARNHFKGKPFKEILDALKPVMANISALSALGNSMHRFGLILKAEA